MIVPLLSGPINSGNALLRNGSRAAGLRNCVCNGSGVEICFAGEPEVMGRWDMRFRLFRENSDTINIGLGDKSLSSKSWLSRVWRSKIPYGDARIRTEGACVCVCVHTATCKMCTNPNGLGTPTLAILSGMTIEVIPGSPQAASVVLKMLSGLYFCICKLWPPQ